MRTLDEAQGEIRTVAFRPDGKVALTVSRNPTTNQAAVRLWNVATGQAEGQPLPFQSPVYGAAFSPDGTAILVGYGHGDWGEARLWDAATGRPLAEPLPHQSPVTAVAFSPDGTVVLTGCYDGTARLWDAATGKLLCPPLRPPPRPAEESARAGNYPRDLVWAVAFSPDGTTALTACSGAVARLWRVPAPLTGTAERIQLWLQVNTGQELDEGGAFRELDKPTWQGRLARLQELGGLTRP
jgi:WD40 repeat protein